MHLILLFAVSGVGAWGATQWLNSRALAEPDLTPRVGGMNANWLMGGLGLAGLVLGGPVVAALGAGVLMGSVISPWISARTKEGLDNVIAVQRQLGVTAPNAAAPLVAGPVNPFAAGIAQMANQAQAGARQGLSLFNRQGVPRS